MHDESLHFEHEDGAFTRVDELVAGLRSEDQLQVVSTALLLAEMGAEAAVAVSDLAAIVDGDGSREVRWAAAYAIGRIGPAAAGAVAVLMRATEDSDCDVREEAHRALSSVLADVSRVAAAMV